MTTNNVVFITGATSGFGGGSGTGVCRGGLVAGAERASPGAPAKIV
ncbi:Uncharacterised protein [Raoultella planticola]|uniref:Short chain dehydrogenase n=1 Tax=Raoultella planticola TaxID=575 RepID=A0A485ALB0_RAOPL|nr:Uncharacterised protein [Raoultella planticola]